MNLSDIKLSEISSDIENKLYKISASIVQDAFDLYSFDTSSYVNKLKSCQLQSYDILGLGFQIRYISCLGSNWRKGDIIEYLKLMDINKNSYVLIIESPADSLHELFVWQAI